MSNTNTNNTNFVFAILNIASGTVSFVSNDITFGEVATYYPNQEVIYMPHFQLEDGDILNYCGEEFTSFEALVEQYGYDALNETLIIDYNRNESKVTMTNTPMYDITNKVILVDSGDDIEEVQHTLFALGCVWKGDTQGVLLDELYGTNVELAFFIDNNKEMMWATSYLAHMEGELDEADVLTFYALTQAIKSE